ncbi:6-hydroxy-D-nicotine oxidase 5 [Colletotrichum chlorophyti]|uniref:6-hydroxy-D-nicotine oxidase 5 n=1 Tax=Colletotrichum chlorophyti TaxID=708187 RepID=A0A1Q8S1A6_9PEZI|nr:6-hydroxy-D-nicotine oxidase 5 [Colletotrichum chlorophyti]
MRPSCRKSHKGFLIFSSTAVQQIHMKKCGPVTQQPLAIIWSRTDAEVTAILQEAQVNGIPFGIRSCVHDLSGAQIQGKDGIIIDLRALDSVVLAEDKQSARVGGGTLSINLSKFLHQRKLLTPHVWCSTIGIAGWALGGGYGYSSAFYGLGVDQIFGARVVLASGEVVDTDDHPDVLWALRGAVNGNFGVVVELWLQVYPENGLLGGLVAFPNAEAAQALTKFGEFEKDLPHPSHMTLPGVGHRPGLAVCVDFGSQSRERLGVSEQVGKSLSTPLLDTVAADFEDYKKWASAIVDELSEKHVALPYVHCNLGPEEDIDCIATYSKETLGKLRAIKKKFDQKNVFDKGHLQLRLYMAS